MAAWSSATASPAARSSAFFFPCTASPRVSQGEGDLVITDVVMPDENAFDMLPRIKKLRPELPVVVMSAQNTLMTAIRASERGAYDYLPKPFDLKELIAIVGRALTEPKARQVS